MTEPVRGKEHLVGWAKEHDILGWDNFLEGRIGRSLFEVQARFLRHIRSRRKIKSWATQFMQQVLRITHQQWIYRNTRIHIYQVEGKTAAEHREIMQAVQESYIMMKPIYSHNTSTYCNRIFSSWDPALLWTDSSG